MNLHDLDKPRMAPTEFFTVEMLERLRDNMDRPVTYYPRYGYYGPLAGIDTGMTPREFEREIEQIRQERDGYWTYTTRVTNLDLPIRVEGVFLDPET